jgi:hypothetical protein
MGFSIVEKRRPGAVFEKRWPDGCHKSIISLQQDDAIFDQRQAQPEGGSQSSQEANPAPRRPLAKDTV